MTKKQETGTHDLGIFKVWLLLEVYSILTIPHEHLNYQQRRWKATLITELNRIGIGVAHFDND